MSQRPDSHTKHFISAFSMWISKRYYAIASKHMENLQSKKNNLHKNQFFSQREKKKWKTNKIVYSFHEKTTDHWWNSKIIKYVFKWKFMFILHLRCLCFDVLRSTERKERKNAREIYHMIAVPNHRFSYTHTQLKGKYTIFVVITRFINGHLKMERIKIIKYVCSVRKEMTSISCTVMASVAKWYRKK